MIMVCMCLQTTTNGPSSGTAAPAPQQAEPEKQMTAVQTRRLGQKEQAAGNTAAPIRQMPAKLAEPTTAEGWKERGNAFFKKGDWAAAKKAYTRWASRIIPMPLQIVLQGSKVDLLIV